MKSRHQKQRWRKVSHGYHQIFHVLKITINEKIEDLKVMEEEDIQDDPNQQVDQGHHNYIEIWFQTVTKLQQHSLLKLRLISSKSKHFITQIQVHVKAYISSLHIIFFVILMCTWLHWKYSYT